MDFYKIGPEGAGRLYEMVAKLAAYLGKESELTAIRTIFAGRAAGLDGDTVRQRLRDTYV